MLVTVLWALEHLNTDDSWTRKDSLIIHLLGTEEAELTNGMAFEEDSTSTTGSKMSQELDQVSPYARNQEFDVDACRRRRTKVRKIVAQTYHNFAKSQGRNFIKPDLAIAFNSGLSQDDIQLWKPTISFLVKNNIPSIFTAYNQDEAEAEAQLLRAAGALLVPSLGPQRNVWGSALTKKEPVKVTGFYAENFWLSGGFR